VVWLAHIRLFKNKYVKAISSTKFKRYLSATGSDLQISRKALNAKKNRPTSSPLYRSLNADLKRHVIFLQMRLDGPIVEEDQAALLAVIAFLLIIL
jgi:hypothetical protein